MTTPTPHPAGARPVKIFVSDIDGCLSEPYRAYRLEPLGHLAAYARQAENGGAEHGLPRLSLCSGRAYPYVEAFTQALGLSVPVVFESGGGLFHLPSARVLWNQAFTDRMASDVEALRRWLIEACLHGTSILYDYGKRTQAGVVGPDVAEVQRLVPVVERYVAENFPGFKVFHTSVSIDVLPEAITKVQALRWLAEHQGVSLAEMAYIGDTNGDLEALRAVGYAFAPSNAVPAVKAVAHRVTEGAVVDGVLEAYRWCVAHNEALRREYRPAGPGPALPAARRTA